MVAQIDKDYFSLGVGKVVRRMVSYAFFEGRPATTKGQFFNPIVFGWLKLINRMPGARRVEKPIFVTGLGRSGTTILGLLMSAHGDAGVLNEPKAIWQLIEPSHDLNDNYSKGLGQYRLHSPDARVIKRAHQLFGQYLTVTRSNRLVDKYPEMIFRAPYLLSIFPDAKIIFITRDGRSAASSIVKWSERLGVSVGDRVDDWWGRSDSKWTRLREQILKKDPYFSDIHDMLSPDLDHEHRAALEWIVTMREGLEQMERLPGHIYRVRYEDIISDPETQLTRLCEFCELSPDSSVLGYAQKVLYENAPKGWPTLDERVDKKFRETMERLGYGGAAP